MKNAAGDLTGNTTSRPGPNGPQALEWDAEGHVKSVSDANGTTEYVYDGGGNRLLAEREGFVLSQVALRVWAELGGLRVVRQGG